MLQNVGPGGLRFSFDFVAASFFALGSGPKELRQLEDNLQRGRDRVIEQITVMQSYGLNALLLKANSPGRRSSSPRKARKDIKILFVDNVDESQSATTTPWSFGPTYADYYHSSMRRLTSLCGICTRVDYENPKPLAHSSHPLSRPPREGTKRSY
jgi:hypothetical protein